MSDASRLLRAACLLTISGAVLALLPALFVPLGFFAEGDALDYRVPILRWMLRHRAYPSWPWTFVDDYPMLGELLMLPFAALRAELARIPAMLAYLGSAFFTARIGLSLAGPAERSRELFLFLLASLLGLQVILVPSAHVMVDGIASCFALGALDFLLRRRPLLSACLLAAALATRYTIWGAAPALLLAMPLLYGRDPRLFARVALIACTGAAPFLIRNWVLNRNPFFPLLNDWFQGPAIPVFEGWGRGRALTDLLLFPFDLLYTNSFVREIFDTKSFTGGFFVYKAGGLLYAQLAALLLVLALRRPAPRKPSREVLATAVFGGALFLFWFFGSQQLRFLGAGMALLNLAILLPLARLSPPPLLSLLALGSLASVANVQRESWKIFLGREESFRSSAYVLSAERCFRRAGLGPGALVGFHDRNALVGYFDFDFVFLPGSSLHAPGGAPPPSVDFIYSGLDFRPFEGYRPWPEEKPCLLRRSAPSGT